MLIDGTILKTINRLTDRQTLQLFDSKINYSCLSPYYNMYLYYIPDHYNACNDKKSKLEKDVQENHSIKSFFKSKSTEAVAEDTVPDHDPYSVATATSEEHKAYDATIDDGTTLMKK